MTIEVACMRGLNMDAIGMTFAIAAMMDPICVDRVEFSRVCGVTPTGSDDI